jgi:hypothetical protein
MFDERLEGVVADLAVVDQTALPLEALYRCLELPPERSSNLPCSLTCFGKPTPAREVIRLMATTSLP